MWSVSGFHLLREQLNASIPDPYGASPFCLCIPKWSLTPHLNDAIDCQRCISKTVPITCSYSAVAIKVASSPFSSKATVSTSCIKQLTYSLPLLRSSSHHHLPNQQAYSQTNQPAIESSSPQKSPHSRIPHHTWLDQLPSRHNCM